jgi:hypothetical protein
MKSGNNELKLRRIQALDQFISHFLAITPLLVNNTPYRDCQQALLGKNLSARHQEVLARIETKVGGAI